MKTVDEALDALARLTNYERTQPDGPRSLDLERPRALLERLGSPHRHLGARVIQVAGTKGKGSTVRFLDSILQRAGLRTGRFLSPHLEHVRERIAIDGAWIPEEEFARHVGTILDAVGSETTFFEAMLATACLHFAEHETDAVVLEVGLGGRLDATTAVPTTHNVITPIGLEHTRILGDTVEQIAFEKAGTIRYAVPVWTGVPPGSGPAQVLQQVALRQEAPLHFVAPPTDVVPAPDGLRWSDRFLRVLGRHQAHNAALAAACCHDLPREAVDDGLMAAEQPGCCEMRGAVMVDGAHTIESIAATIATLHDHRPGARPVLLFALARDKDLDRIAPLLAPHVQEVVCVRADPKRGRSPEELAAHPVWASRAQSQPSVREGLELALRLAGGPGLVLATGSVYLAGAVRPLA